MHILFKMADQRSLGIIQIVGRYIEYCVGYIPDTHRDVVKLDHLSPTVLEESVANGWMFADGWRGHVSVKANTDQETNLSLSTSFEDGSYKTKYVLSDAEIVAGTEFLKAIMRKKVDEVYDGRFKALNLSVTELEASTWSQQREEAKGYRTDNTVSVPTVTKLAESRGIPVEEMVTKIETAVAAYNDTVTTLLAKKQTAEIDIKCCINIIDCLVLLHNRFELTMPIPLQDQLGVVESAKFNI